MWCGQIQIQTRVLPLTQARLGARPASDDKTLLGLTITLILRVAVQLAEKFCPASLFTVLLGLQ
jgi:hypothetical protein